MLLHRLATPVIQPRMYFFDQDGKPLVGGKVHSFKVGTDEFKPTYRNSEFTAANQNPILLDQAGSALIYIRGSVQLKIYDKQGNLIEEKIEYQQRELTQFFDNYGKALSNGKIWTYDYQSTIKKTSYKYEDIQNTNPVVLDQDGWGAINIVGAYRLRVLDKNNMVVGDQDFKRPPTRVLTSRIYPLYFEEGVTNELLVCDAQSKKTLNESSLDTEKLFSKYVVGDAVIREMLLNLSLEEESIVSVLNIGHASIRELLTKIPLEPEKLSSSITVGDTQVTKTVNYLLNVLEPEKLSSSITVGDAITSI